MSNVRLIVREQKLNGIERVLARVLIWRGEAWVVCGVFELLRPEWLRLAEHCIEHGIPVTHEQTPTISLDATAAV